MTLTEFLLARIAEDVERAEREREFHKDWPDTPACDSCNPARVLAECEAKRQIVETVESKRGVWITGVAAFEILDALALPYADHPDFDESWRP